MRRIMFTAVASLAILAIAPASVLAKHHSKRHQSRTHHARVHRARVRHERFGVITAPSSSLSGTTTTTTPPATDTAGTVNTFDGTTLVIKLTDGTLVSGKVGPNTEMECQTAETDDTNDAMHADGDQGGGDQNTSGGDQNSSGGGDENGTVGANQGTVGANQGADNNDQGDDTGAPTPSCTSANLVTGAVVGGAELGISSAGATWDKVELVG